MIKLPADRSQWPSYILSTFYMQHPQLSVSDAKVVINDKGGDTQLAGVYFTIGSTRFLAPVVIRDGHLYNFSTLVTPDGKLMAFTYENIYKYVTLGQPTSNVPKTTSQSDLNLPKERMPLPVALEKLRLQKLGEASAYVQKRDKRRKVIVKTGSKTLWSSPWVSATKAMEILKQLGFYADERLVKEGGLTYPYENLPLYEITTIVDVKKLDGTEDVAELKSFTKLAEGNIGSFYHGTFATEPLHISRVDKHEVRAYTLDGQPVQVKFGSTFALYTSGDEYLLVVPRDAKFVKTATTSEIIITREGRDFVIVTGRQKRKMDEDQAVRELRRQGYVSDYATTLVEMLKRQPAGTAIKVPKRKKTASLKKLAQQLQRIDAALGSKLLQALQKETKLNPELLSQLETELAKLLLKSQLNDSVFEPEIVEKALLNIAKLRYTLSAARVMSNAPNSEVV